MFPENEVLENWQGQRETTSREKGWRTQSRLIFFPSPIPFLFFLSGYGTGGFINHHLDSLCQRELTAFGPIRCCRDNSTTAQVAPLCQELSIASLSLPTEREKINPYQHPRFPPLIWGFCAVPGACQTITDIITSALIFFKESRVSPSN